MLFFLLCTGATRGACATEQECARRDRARAHLGLGPAPTSPSAAAAYTTPHNSTTHNKHTTTTQLTTTTQHSQCCIDTQTPKTTFEVRSLKRYSCHRPH